MLLQVNHRLAVEIINNAVIPSGAKRSRGIYAFRFVQYDKLVRRSLGSLRSLGMTTLFRCSAKQQFSFLFNRGTVIQYQGAVQKQHILPLKIQEPIQKIDLDIPDIHQGHPGIVLHQQRDHGTPEGIPEDD